MMERKGTPCGDGAVAFAFWGLVGTAFDGAIGVFSDGEGGCAGEAA